MRKLLNYHCQENGFLDKNQKNLSEDRNFRTMIIIQELPQISFYLFLLLEV